jgi:hypothetical protein
MNERKGTRTIKSARSYTMAQAAGHLGVSLNTIRNHVKDGLPILRTERPFLIQGEQLKAWYTARSERAKQPLKPEQMLCLRCKSPQAPPGRHGRLHRSHLRKTAAVGALPRLRERHLSPRQPPAAARLRPVLRHQNEQAESTLNDPL